MATRGKSGVLLPAIIVVAVVVILGGEGVTGAVTDFVDDIVGGDTEIVGDGEYAFMVASKQKPEVTKCTAQQLIQDKRCGDLKVVVFDAGKMPFITRGVSEAWEHGLPAVLTMNRAKATENRKAACGSKRYKKQFDKTSCDEYPMAATDQGGADAHIEEVPESENWCQGGTVRPQYPHDGEDFLVVISSPGKIAPKPYAGVPAGTEEACQG